MCAERRRMLFGFSWLGLLNFFLLQWFTIRLVETTVTEYGESRHEKWSLKFGIAPLSGWQKIERS